MTAELRRLATTILCLPVLALAVAGSPRPALAEPDSQGQDGQTTGLFEKFWTRDTMTGDWGGLRTLLHDHGLDLNLRLAQYGQWVTAGGVDQTGQYGGTVDYRLKVDTNKLLGTWKGLSLDVHARTRYGEDLGGAAGAFALENTGLLSQIPGRYHDTDVTGLTFTQLLPFFRERILDITLGKLDVIDTVDGFFPSMGYGQDGFWNINGMVTSLPWFGAVTGLSLYGGYAVTINQEYQMAESGLLATGTANVSTSWNVHDSFDDGVWLAAFQRFFWKMDDKPGYFMVFGGYSTRDQPSNDPRDITVIPGQGIEDDEEKPWNIAMYVYQVLWQVPDDPDRKVTILMGGTVGPDDPQIGQYHFFTNVELYGPMAWRPRDRMGVSGYKNWLSDNFKDLVSPVIELRDAWGIEAYYNIEINPWLHLTADIQVIRDEIRGDSVAVVPGVRLVMDL